MSNYDKNIFILTAGSEVLTANRKGGSFMINQASILSSLGYHVKFISVGFHSLSHLFKNKRYPSEEKINGFTIYRSYINWYFIQRLSPFGIKLFFQRKLLKKLFLDLKLRGELPDLIISHYTFYSGILASEISKEFNIPFIIQEHSSDFMNYGVSKIRIKMIKKLLSDQTIYCVSQKFANELSKLLEVKCSSFPNAINQIYEEKLPTKFSGKNIIVIGNLIPIKNIFDIIKAFKLAKISKEVNLKIFGKGPLEIKIMDLIKNDPDLNNRVKIVPYAPPKQLREELLNSLCLLHGAKYETFGVALVEALFCGSRVITTDVGIASELINNRNGVIVSNTDEMATALEKYCNNILSLKERIEISNEAKKKFGIEAYSNNIIKLINKNLN